MPPRWNRIYIADTPSAPAEQLPAETDFVDLGWTDTDGISYPAEDQPVRVDMGSSSVTVVVDRIDDTLRRILTGAPADPEQLLVCACGCGARLRDDGPSFYFATLACQEKWNRRRDRGQAETAPGPDAYTVEHPPAEPVQTCADLYGAAYRRMCHGCDTMVIPVVRQRTPAPAGEPDPFTRPATPRIQLTNECPQCQREMLGAAYAAQVHHRGANLMLELGDGESRVRRQISIAHLERFHDRDGLFLIMWTSMARQLNAFQRSWHGQQALDRRQEV